MPNKHEESSKLEIEHFYLRKGHGVFKMYPEGLAFARALYE